MMSFENLVMMCPIGVVSKNKIGALKTPHTIFEWIFCEELKHEIAIIMHLIKLKRSDKATNHINTFI